MQDTLVRATPSGWAKILGNPPAPVNDSPISTFVLGGCTVYAEHVQETFEKDEHWLLETSILGTLICEKATAWCEKDIPAMSQQLCLTAIKQGVLSGKLEVRAVRA